MPQSKITSSRLCGPPTSPSWLSGGIGGESDFEASVPERIAGLGVPRSKARIDGASAGGGADFQASGPERISGLGVTRSEAGICDASVGGAAIAGSGSDAHPRPCLKLSRRVLATLASSMLGEMFSLALNAVK